MPTERGRRSPAYHIAATTPWAVAIIDDYGPDLNTPTVTNGAKTVVQDLLALGVLDGTQRLVYRDTEEVWDEIVYDATGFKGFSPLRATSLQDALIAVKNPPGSTRHGEPT